jgi:Zn-dependent protease with chaperone function
MPLLRSKCELPRVHGIRVSYSDKLSLLSESRGIWPWKKIVVGPLFWQLTFREQGAVLLHEAGHCRNFHLEKRLLMTPYILFRPSLVLQICAEQEFEADFYSAAHGYSYELMTLFQKMTAQKSPFHPDMASRIERLKVFIENQAHLTNAKQGA